MHRWMNIYSTKNYQLELNKKNMGYTVASCLQFKLGDNKENKNNHENMLMIRLGWKVLT